MPTIVLDFMKKLTLRSSGGEITYLQSAQEEELVETCLMTSKKILKKKGIVSECRI